MTDSSGSSPSAHPPERGAPADASTPTPDTASYPAMWTRRVLVTMALLGVAVVVAAVLWAGGGGGHHAASTAPAGQVGSAEAGGPAEGSTRSTTPAGTGTSTSSAPGRPATTLAGAPTTRPGTRAPTTPPTTSAAPTSTTAETSNFYHRGPVGPCPASLSTDSSAQGSPAGLSQATTVASCLVHAWEWQLTSSQDGKLGMDALADSALIPTLMNLGHFLDHLQLAPAGCTVEGAQGSCTFTDGATNVLFRLQQSAAYTYGWLVTAVSWDAATRGGSTTSTAPFGPPSTAAAPASTPAGTAG